MRYVVVEELLDEYEQNVCYLLKGQIHKGLLMNDWNDYGYRTIYTLFRNNQTIGVVKIGEFNMLDRQWTPNIPAEFTSLDSRRFFSVGCTDDYYSTISEANDETLFDVLMDLNDFTVSHDIYERAKFENVTKYSLLREIPEKKWDSYIKDFYDLLRPPLNLRTMRRIFGSTGWTDVDEGLVEMERLLFQANTHLYYNAIATIGREIIINITDKIYDDELHRDKSKYQNKPTNNQFVNKLHGYIDYACTEEKINKNMKEYLKSTVELFQGYVHKQNAEHFESFMCVHAVITLAFQLSILVKEV